MTIRALRSLGLVLSLGVTLSNSSLISAAPAQLLGWNNLGMHCMDSDYSVFSILPPYNTVEAQLIVNGRLVTNNAVYSVTYQAVADPSGSINSTAMGKGNFYQYDLPLYGVDLAAEAGLAGFSMPGTSNIPQSMPFQATNSQTRVNWYHAEGIPITPYDDALRKNPYPLMRLIARDAAQVAIATNDVVLPVSDEMDCRVCHASGSQGDAEPLSGWVWNANPERDQRLNILKLHDELRNPVTWPGILASNGFNPQGLYRSVVADNRPVLCAKCHLSEALPGSGFGNLPPLTEAIHGLHATVTDPDSGLLLDNAASRSACYRCHPGSTTRCLRGAMGAAVDTSGQPAMQCQNCHGKMSQVGAPDRVGWLEEPNCQSCHIGNANNTPFRFTTVFDASGQVRQPADLTFATDTNTPAPGLSLFRFSSGHGGLQCSACHGSTHAEFPSTHPNDNIRAVQVQGHVGMLSECSACHPNPAATGGPHQMHIATTAWINGHDNDATCDNCHGGNYRGTELSEAKADRTFSTGFGTKRFWRGYRVGCYTCHNGPSNTSTSPWKQASVDNVSTNTTSGKSVFMALSAKDTNSTPQTLTLRVIGQPAGGTVGLTNWNTTNWAATYYPQSGFVGTDKFTFAAWNGYVDSLLRTGTVAVTQGPFSIAAQTQVPPSYPAGWPVPFGVVPAPSNITAAVTFDWDFGDGSLHNTTPFVTHTYLSPGTYTWSVVSSVQSGPTTATATNRGTILITAPVTLLAEVSGSDVVISWSRTTASLLLEESPQLGAGAVWSATTNSASSVAGRLRVTLPNPSGSRFYRLRQL